MSVMAKMSGGAVVIVNGKGESMCVQPCLNHTVASSL